MRGCTRAAVGVVVGLLASGELGAQCGEDRIELAPGLNTPNGTKVRAIDGSFAMVLDRDNDQVLVFREFAGVWTAQGPPLTPSDASAGVGAIFLDVPWAVVRGLNDGDDDDLFVFHWNGSVWSQTQYLPLDESLSVGAGANVAIDDDLMAVTAAGLDSSGGQVYVYRLVAGVWQFEALIQPPDALQSKFAASISLRDGVLAVGAPGGDIAGQGFDSGWVQLYEYDGAQWQLVQQLVASNAIERTDFGRCVRFSDHGLVIGSSEFDFETGSYDPPGSVYVFQLDGPEWVETQRLQPYFDESNTRFGRDLFVDGGTMLVYATSLNQNLAQRQYIYRWNGSAWRHADSMPLESGIVLGADLLFGPENDLRSALATSQVLPDGSGFHSGIQAAADDDAVCRIELVDGVHTNAGVIIDRTDLLITAESKPGPVVIDADGADRVMTFGPSCDATVAVEWLTFRGGSATGHGGGVLCDGGSPTLRRLRIVENHATGDGGGLAAINGAAPHLDTCLIADNAADGRGGGVRTDGGLVTLSACTVAGNTAVIEAGGVSGAGSGVALQNTIAWGNQPGPNLGAIHPLYSIVEGNAKGLGSFDADPGFLDPSSGDYRLDSGSTAIDAGANFLADPEATSDLDEASRPIDDIGADDVGAGAGSIVDIGAFEFQAVSGRCNDYRIFVPTPQLGTTVDISGDYAIVGAKWDDEVALNAGAAFVYRRIGSTWQLEAKLTASDAGISDEFGTSVAIDGNRIVVSAPDAPGPGQGNAGALYVFERGGSGWQEVARLAASDVYRLGEHVALDGDIIAAVNGSDGLSPTGDSVVVYFRLSGSLWVLGHRLFDDPTTCVTEKRVMIDGDVLAIAGNNGCEEQPPYPHGVQVFDLDLPDWIPRPVIDSFGRSSALAGDRVIVARPSDDTVGDRAGSATVYCWNGAGWDIEWILYPDPGPAGINGGMGAWWGIDFDGTIAAFGQTGSDIVGTSSGSVVAFERSGTEWAFRGRMVGYDTEPFDLLGREIAVDGGRIMTVSGADSPAGTGAMYIFSNAACSADLTVPCGVVDVEDLLAVVNDWGCERPPGQCLGDIAAPFGIVDADDLLTLVNNWGTCPGQ